MDASRYREVMTGLFFHGEVPPERPVDGQSGPRRASPPPKSKIDQLREFTESIAARNQPAE